MGTHALTGASSPPTSARRARRGGARAVGGARGGRHRRRGRPPGRAPRRGAEPGAGGRDLRPAHAAGGAQLPARAGDHGRRARRPADAERARPSRPPLARRPRGPDGERRLGRRGASVPAPRPRLRPRGRRRRLRPAHRARGQPLPERRRAGGRRCRRPDHARRAARPAGLHQAPPRAARSPSCARSRRRSRTGSASSAAAGTRGSTSRSGSGARVGAAGRGVVKWAGWNTGGYGYLVVVRHRLGFETWYAHLSAIAVRIGQTTVGGTLIGYAGSTGRSTGPHLHFEARRYGTPVDPAPRLLQITAARGSRRGRRLTCRANADARGRRDADPPRARFGRCP